MEPAFKLGLNYYTVKCVFLGVILAFFLFTVSFAAAVSVYAFPRTYNFYLSETIVFGFLSLAPATFFAHLLSYMKTGKMITSWKTMNRSAGKMKYPAIDMKSLSMRVMSLQWRH